MRTTLLVAALALLVAALPAATAHGAPEPMDKETRLLEDWVDDCGGDGGAASGSCKGSQDLLALDIQESYDPNLGEAAIFRLYADKGATQPHKDVISMTAPGGTKTFTFQTSDDAHFTNGGGFDKVGTAHALAGDATRFYVEGTVRLSGLGGVGATLSNFRVEAYAASSVGDFMPGGCHNTVGDCVDAGAHDDYTRKEYVLKGPTQYVRFEPPAATQQVPAGAERIVEIPLTNLLSDQGQSVSINVAGADGLQARFHNPADPSGSGYSNTGQVDLAAKAETIMHLSLSGLTAGRTGTLTLTVSTDLGGRIVKEVAYEVTPAQAGTSCNPAMPAMTGMSGPSQTCTVTKSSPPLAAGMALLALALVARSRRS